MRLRVLIQAGHLAPRQPGLEAYTGTVREQELTKALQRRLVELFEADDRFDPVPCPGRIDPSQIGAVDAALFLHGDGSDNKAASGYSFGFPVHPVNERLATLINEEFQSIPDLPRRRDNNYTRGLARYYGYRSVATDGPEVLVEHGFLTNPAEQKWIFSNLDQLASAEYRAVCRYFDFVPGHAVSDSAVMGFTVIGEKAGETRVIKRTLEPGRAVDRLKDWGARLITVVRADEPSPEPGETYSGVPEMEEMASEVEVTPDSPLLADPRATQRQVSRYLHATGHGPYSSAQVETIVGLYDTGARAVGLDPMVAVAQMVLETGHLTSEWSQRPHHNPAGIGVTGEPGKGVSFPDWDSAVAAHLGRLLAYALPAGAGNQRQTELIAEALQWRSLPDGLRGAAPRLSGLAGTWARDPEYATKIARVANEIRLTSP